MARIRSLKIGFFRNEHLAEFSFGHRLLFEGLWLLADKAGRLEDRPKRIAADLFPFDRDVDVQAMLKDLAAGDDPFILRYEVGGKAYIQICNFAKHQRPNSREVESEIPPPLSFTRVRVQDQGEQEGEGKGREQGGREHDDALASPPAALVQAWNNGTTAPIPQCRELSQDRRKKALARLKDADIGEWATVIARIEASPFCRGENDRGWVATFDWLLQPDTRVKVLEGKYDPRKPRAPGYQPQPEPAYEDWTEECDRTCKTRCESRYKHGLMRGRAS